MKNCVVLDIGIGSGHIAKEIGKGCKELHGIDVVDERVVKEGYLLSRVKGEVLPFKDNMFDVVISNQVLEHVGDKKKHVDEIRRVLKKGGICYLATPNKFWIIEPHFKLPFLSWFPRSIAKRYLKLLKGKNWDVDSPSFNQLKKLTNSFSERHNMALEVIKHPEKYSLDVFAGINKVSRLLPYCILRFCSNFLPSFIFVLRK